MSILQSIFAVDTKIGFERPVQGTLGWPIDLSAFEISDFNIGSMDRSDSSVCNRNTDNAVDRGGSRGPDLWLYFCDLLDDPTDATIFPRVVPFATDRNYSLSDL